MQYKVELSIESAGKYLTNIWKILKNIGKYLLDISITYKNNLFFDNCLALEAFFTTKKIY